MIIGGCRGPGWQVFDADPRLGRQIRDWITSAIRGITSLWMTKAQVTTNQAITNLQLQRAQAGLSPLNIGLGANGLPMFGSSLGGGTSLLLLGGGLLVLFMLMRGGSRRAA